MIKKKKYPASEFKFNCYGPSLMKTPGEIVSLVWTYPQTEVRLIRYNQADDRITTICNYGHFRN